MILLKTSYTFVLFFEILVILYIVMSWLFKNRMLAKRLRGFLAPILDPLERLTANSSIYMPIIELGPILFLIILIYIEQILIDLF